VSESDKPRLREPERRQLTLQAMDFESKRAEDEARRANGVR